MVEEHLCISKKDLLDIFEIKNDLLYLKNSWAKPIKINFPLILDDSVAKIIAMILDGSLCKNLTHLMFSQKKDKSKVEEFFKIIYQLFNLKGNLKSQNGGLILKYNSKVLAHFMYYALDLYKSDENTRIPKWIWYSSDMVIKEYLRYAFAMEGSINNFYNGGDIKFHSCDLSYVKELKLFLKNKFNINSAIRKYYINGYGWKYYVNISKNKDIKLFYRHVGFALKSHQKILEEGVKYIKPRAWEITLVKIFEINFNFFTISDVKFLFPNLCRSAIYYRLNILVDFGYLFCSPKKKYFISKDGENIAKLLKKNINFVSLRTNPKDNELIIYNYFLNNGESFVSKIARDLMINRITVRDTITRLIKTDRLIFIRQDKFQRKYFNIIEKNKGPHLGGDRA